MSSSQLSAPAIEKIETILVDLPTIRPHRLSMTIMDGQTLLLARIRFTDGITGLGEGTTIGGLAYGAESPESMKLAIDTYIAPILKAERFASVAAAMARVNKMVAGNRFAKCAVETALMDAWGQRVGLPISELLGGRRRGRLPVAWTLASGDTGKDIDEAERMLDLRRHQAFKLKIGRREVMDDVAHVGAVKKALGDRASVRVDVNMAWNESQAMRGVAALEDAGCDLVEQPVPRHTDSLARLAARFIIPIMADESLCGPRSAFEIASAAAADVFAVKTSQSGGLYAAGQVAAIAGAAGLGLYGGTMLEGAPGTIAAAHLFSTFAQLDWGTELFGPLLLTEEILTTPLDYSDFELTVPEGPGLGIELDEDRVAFFRRDAARRTLVINSASGSR